MRQSGPLDRQNRLTEEEQEARPGQQPQSRQQAPTKRCDARRFGAIHQPHERDQANHEQGQAPGRQGKALGDGPVQPLPCLWGAHPE